MKKRALSKIEEFDILKIVADKFILLAVFILGIGLYRIIFALGSIGYNILVIIAGVILLLLFIALFVKEYEYIKL